MTKMHAAAPANKAEHSPAQVHRAPPAVAAQTHRAPPAVAAQTHRAPPAAQTSLSALTQYPVEPTTLLADESEGTRFLAELRPHVLEAVGQELAGTDWTADNCPWIDYWFSYYGGRSAEDIEAALRKYAPAARDARDVADYVPAVVERVRQGVVRWRKTGDVDGPTGMNVERGANGEQIGDTAAFEVASLGEGQRVMGLPPAIASTLGGSFSDVQVHIGDGAAQLARRADALAFTLGNHVVYGANAPQPGTLEGDALLAHELAHVQQQRGAPPAGRVEMTASPAHEANADAAVAQAASGYFGRGGAMHRAWSAISAPLSLSRCKDKSKEKEIKELTERKAELERTYATETEFSALAAADAELTATEHWLATLKGGKGPRTGSTSGETGLPTCNCTTYVADVLERTYKKIDKGERWEAVKKQALKLNPKGESGLNGLQIQSALMSERGWMAIYFAPDPTYKHYRKKKRDQAGNLLPGPDGGYAWEPDEHASWTYANVKKGNPYRGMFKVSHMVINYRPEAKNPSGPTPEQSTTVKDTSQLDKLAKIPFGVLTVRGAYHMALLIHGVVYEAHLGAKSNEYYLYERKPLEQWGWNEGVVVAPADEVKKAFGTP